MTGWQLFKLAIAGVVVGILVVGALTLSPWILPPDPNQSVTRVDGRLIGETEGYVWNVDRPQQQFLVTSSIVGLRAVPITVTPDTKIVVRDKIGGFDDIWKGIDVRVSYEVRDGTRVATSVDVATTRARAARVRATEALPSPPPEPETPPKTSSPTPAITVSPAPLPAPRTPARAPTPPAEARRPAPLAPPTPRAPAASTAPSQPARAPVAPRTSPGETDAADGSAAVDWLLKDSRR